jgi:hypothetical protein
VKVVEIPKVPPIEPEPKPIVTRIAVNCVIDSARSYVGHKETKENDSKYIRKWLKNTGIKTPAPWCTAFSCNKLQSCGIKNPMTAWTPTLGNTKLGTTIYLRNKSGKIPTEVKAPMIHTLYYKNLGREGHSGIVAAISGKSVVAIEGNTTFAGTRESKGVDGVREIWRPKHQIYKLRTFTQTYEAN